MYENCLSVSVLYSRTTANKDRSNKFGRSALVVARRALTRVLRHGRVSCVDELVLGVGRIVLFAAACQPKQGDSDNYVLYYGTLDSP